MLNARKCFKIQENTLKMLKNALKFQKNDKSQKNVRKF